MAKKIIQVKEFRDNRDLMSFQETNNIKSISVVPVAVTQVKRNSHNVPIDYIGVNYVLTYTI